MKKFIVCNLSFIVFVAFFGRAECLRRLNFFMTWKRRSMQTDTKTKSRGCFDEAI